eukprot:TRINITY_DN7717_c0_g1_i2.p1 TRINITY_DN7717_c0_g1~~TRINITY_DN7717_c0_g1_i2.p1  ORF type:complete len:134 (-),score=27.04 TRINITY_DN7717_c0_g1_i2:79-480(-)
MGSKEKSDISTLLDKLLYRVSGLQGVLITDRDGVVLAKAVHPSHSIDDSAIENSLAATFAVASDQASKLHHGKNKSITSFFNDRVLVHITVPPLVVGFIALPSANVGMILALTNEIQNALSGLSDDVLSMQDL